MSARDAILERIGSAIKTGNSLNERRTTVAARVGKPAEGIIPKTGETRDEIVSLFIEKAKAAEASIDMVTKADVGDAIQTYLREHNLPKALRMGSDERLKPAAKQLGSLVEINEGRSHGDDLVGLSHAFGGVAETGTLILTSGNDNPTTLNFLPENHIVMINEGDIQSSYEAVLANVRKRYGAGQMPRTVNMITGPSRSADIEQTLILGAHGPVRLHILVIKD